MILVNGVASDVVSVFDRGLQYGDGLFETIAVKSGQAQRLQQHLSRLQHGLQRLHFPQLDEVAINQDIERVLSKTRDGILKILITRGVGERGYAIPSKQALTRVVYSASAPDYDTNSSYLGIRVRICDTRLSHNPQLAGLKHLCRLENVLARAEWDDATIFEGLMMDTSGHFIEGVMSNIFVVRDECLLTPRVDQCGVAGIMRDEIMKAARELNIKCQQQQIGHDDLQNATEMFICNSLIGLWPVNEIISIKKFDLPNDPDTITRRLQQWLS